MFFDTTTMQAGMEGRLADRMGFEGGWNDRLLDLLPFGPDDATAGSESELQVAVMGSPDCVDLPLRIRESSFYQNVARRTVAGDTSSHTLLELERYLEAGPDAGLGKQLGALSPGPAEHLCPPHPGA